MTCEDVVDQAIAMVQHRGRVTSRMLKQMDPRSPLGLFGGLAVACQREHPEVVERVAWQLVKPCPDWSESDLIVSPWCVIDPWPTPADHRQSRWHV
jgi:hypothetical protein